MDLSQILDWIRINQGVAFWVGVAVLIAIGLTYNFLRDMLESIVQAIRGIPPEITVECCCSCHDEHDEEEPDENSGQ